MNEDVKSENLHIHSRADELIACLEGEIAKRDARIVELESRIVWLECESQVSAAPVSEAKAQGVVMPDVNAAAKALCNSHAMICGVDADDQWKEYSQDFIADAETVLANARLNSAPVQQVSVPDGEDWSVFFGYLIDKCEGHIIAEENLQGWLSEMLADPHYCALFRREKTAAEQYSPIAMSIEAAEEEHGSLRAAAKALGIDPGYLSRLKSGEKINPSAEILKALGLERITYFRAMLAAAPAAPAADASDVLEQAMYTLISIGYHENSGLVHELRQALAAHRAQEAV